MRGVPRPRRAISRAASGADRDPEDARRSPHDLGQLVLGVEVEAVRRAEPIAQRTGDAAGARGGADDRERLERQPQRPRRRTLADHHVERVVLHRRIEDLLDGAIEPVDLIDEQHVALVQRGQDRGQVPCPLDGGPARVADVHAELARDDRREGRLAEARRAVQQDVVGRLFAHPGRSQQHVEVRLDLGLPDVLGNRPRPQGRLDLPIGVVEHVRGEDLGDLVHHGQDSSVSYVCSSPLDDDFGARPEPRAGTARGASPRDLGRSTPRRGRVAASRPRGQLLGDVCHPHNVVAPPCCRGRPRCGDIRVQASHRKPSSAVRAAVAPRAAGSGTRRGSRRAGTSPCRTARPGPARSRRPRPRSRSRSDSPRS